MNTIEKIEIEIFKKIREIIINFTKLPETEVDIYSDFFRDLKLNLISRAKLISKVEKSFNIIISDNNISCLNRVLNLVDCVVYEMAQLN